ncbi:hypothetical protein [Paenibacillus luteus]|uniref:hypothetical protein n=1 Tax=Paenibacillus luteus TaxID=2545753 RepID=UPI001144B37B|nr:hypothetical protein [Paenibacillus luteus]
MNVCVIGAGELGSRHVQAIGKVKQPLNIFIVDPNSRSLNMAKTRFEESTNGIHQLYLLQTLDQLPKSIYFLVVSTNSLVRYEIINYLFENDFQIEYLMMEKFLFPSLLEFDNAAVLFENQETKVFVNCGRRIIDFYQEIKSLFQNAESIHFKVEGWNLGIGCNGIHFLDWFSYMVNDKAISISSSLDNEILQSKRSGFIEFTGELFGFTETGDQFSLISYSENELRSPTLIEISSSQVKCVINESEFEASVMKSSDNWNVEKYSYRIPFQSEMTNELIESTLENKSIGLPDYDKSMILHKQLLKEFLDHLVTITGKELSQCMIT